MYLVVFRLKGTKFLVGAFVQSAFYRIKTVSDVVSRLGLGDLFIAYRAKYINIVRLQPLQSSAIHYK